MTDICAPALNQVSCELAPNARALRLVEVWRKVRELAIEQAQERPERFFVAAVRCCCYEYEVSRRVTSDFLNKFEALLPSAPNAACQRATMGLVYDHELRTFENEVFSARRAVDEVRRDDREAVSVEHGHAHRQIAFKPLDAAAQNQL